MSYDSLEYLTPEVFKNKYKDKSALIIGTGHSTKNLVQYKSILRDKFDVIIGLNFSTRDFESQLHFHMVLEKNPALVYNSMKQDTYRLDLPRILNWKSINKFPKDINAIKATRSNFEGDCNIREYSANSSEGFLIGPLGNKKLSIGSVSLNALHFACILGCSKVYMIGADLMFKDQYDHYYPDNHYRKSKTKLANRSPIITIKHSGKEYKTTKFFEESSKYIDTIINTKCRPLGIEVFDFSDGLISSAADINIDDFMKERV